MLFATHRTAATENPKCNRVYLRDKVVRTTPVLAEEMARRVRFATLGATLCTLYIVHCTLILFLFIPFLKKNTYLYTKRECAN